MRKFKLYNSLGTAYDISVSGTAFLSSPQGLGFSMDRKYSRIGNAYVRDYYRLAQGTIRGTLVLNGYSQFQTLIGFIASEGLTLEYTPIENGTAYKRDVDFASITKTELTAGGVLECEIEISCKTMWYTKSTHSFTNSGSFTLTNDGHVPASWKLTVDVGSGVTFVKGQTVELRQNGITLKRASFTSTDSFSGQLVWSARDGEAKAVWNGTNVVPLMDFTQDNFFKIPVGTYTFVVFGYSSGTSGTLEVYKEYLAV